jgi:hypothetical protein
MGWAEGSGTRVEETSNDQEADDDGEVGGVVHCGRVGKAMELDKGLLGCWSSLCWGREQSSQLEAHRPLKKLRLDAALTRRNSLIGQSGTFSFTSHCLCRRRQPLHPHQGEGGCLLLEECHVSKLHRYENISSYFLYTRYIFISFS